MDKYLIIGPGNSPIPATKGGAVESLVEYIMLENEKRKEIDLSIASIFEEKAFEQGKEYIASKFLFYKVGFFPRLLDNITYFIAKNILKKKKVLSYRYIFQRIFFAKYVSKLLKKNNYDKVIIENHVLLLRCLKSKKLRKKYSGKYYYHEHNEIKSTLGMDKVILGCKKIITVSDYISKSFNLRYPQYEKSDIVKLPNVADTRYFGKKYDVSDLIKKYDIKGKRIILFAGRLSQEKGALEVLSAFNNLHLSNTKLLIVGSYCYDTKMSNGFENTLQNLAISNKDNIIFTGYVPFSDMPRIYQLADVVVLPSIWEDPAPLSIIETLVSGKALITTYSGGIPEYAKDISILLKRDNNLEDNIKNSILYLLTNDNERKKLEEKAFAATRDWTISTYFDNLLNICK